RATGRQLEGNHAARNRASDVPYFTASDARGDSMKTTAALALAIALLTSTTAAQRPSGADGALSLNRETAMWLATFPLGCIDKLHDPPRGRGYVFESSITLKPNFQKTRAFYGCFDWHSSVNSTWTMVK